MDYFHWGVDPNFIHFGFLTIRWYGLLFVGGLLLSLAMMKWIYKREGYDPDSLDDFLLYIIVGVIVGARLAHTLIYEPDYFLAHPIEILYVWRGGLASHGGVLGAIIATYIYSKKYNLNFQWVLSRITIPGTLVGAFIRVGNFFNSEILGKASTLPWAVVFERVDLTPRHPVQLYEALVYFGIFLLLLFLYLRLKPETVTNTFMGIFLFLAFGIRFLLEYFKTEQADYSTALPFTVGQLLSLPVIIFGLLWIIWGVRESRKV